MEKSTLNSTTQWENQDYPAQDDPISVRGTPDNQDNDKMVRVMMIALIIHVVTIISVSLITGLLYLSSTCADPKRCFDTLYEVSQSIDVGVDPCDDFYSYVCGTTIAEKSYGPFIQLQIRVVMYTVKSHILHNVDDGTLAQDKVSILLLSCFRDTLHVNHRDDVARFFSNISLQLPGISADRGTTWKEMVDIIVRLSLDFQINLIFDVDIFPIVRTPHSYTLAMGISEELGEWMMERQMLLTTGALFDYFKNTVQSLSPHAEISSEFIDQLLFLDNELAAFASYDILRKPDFEFRTIKNVTYNESYWVDALNKHLPDGLKINLDSEIFFVHLKSTTEFIHVLSKKKYLSSSITEAYIGFRLIRHFRPLDIFSALTRCIINTDKLMPIAFIQPLMNENHMSQDAIRKAESLVKEIRKSHYESIKNTLWIDETTRSAALDKITQLKERVGTPKSQNVNELYRYVPRLTEKSYIDKSLSILKASSSHWKRILQTNGSSDKTSEFIGRLSMTQVNAYYVPISHYMVIPTAILFPPFFSISQHSVINFAALGHIIGHETTHAFDPELGLYNQSGIKVDWWSNFSRNNFEQQLSCLKKTYNTNPWTEGMSYGDSAMSENFADIGGMRKSFHAYKRVSKDANWSPVSRNIPKSLLKYSQDQIFFIASCFKWCTGQEVNITQTYSSPWLRCNVPLMNLKEFGDSFQCVKDAAMNPPTKCDTI